MFYLNYFEDFPCFVYKHKNRHRLISSQIKNISQLFWILMDQSSQNTFQAIPSFRSIFCQCKKITQNYWLYIAIFSDQRDRCICHSLRKKKLKTSMKCLFGAHDNFWSLYFCKMLKLLKVTLFHISFRNFTRVVPDHSGTTHTKWQIRTVGKVWQNLTPHRRTRRPRIERDLIPPTPWYINSYSCIKTRTTISGTSHVNL